MRSGKVATIHEAPVAYKGSTFVGYTIIDPVTGAGAYKIGGGENGGFLSTDFADYLTLFGIGVGIVGLLFSSPALVILSSLLSLVVAVNSWFAFRDQIAGTRCQGSGAAELFAALVLGPAIFGFIFGGVAAFAILGWIGFL